MRSVHDEVHKSVDSAWKHFCLQVVVPVWHSVFNGVSFTIGPVRVVRDEINLQRPWWRRPWWSWKLFRKLSDLEDSGWRRRR